MGKNNDLALYGWDDLLPDYSKNAWQTWLKSLHDLHLISISRSFYPINFHPISQEIHAFSDASKSAIGYIIYIRSFDTAGKCHVSFVTASSKVAPRCATTMPRMELCAALDCTRCVQSVISELDSEPKNVFMYTDSRIVIGYINNTHKRFAKYVERRVSNILSVTKKEDRNCVNTADNPADIASRPHSPMQREAANWYSGPAFLCYDNSESKIPIDKSLSPDPLPEEKPVVSVLCCQESSPKNAFSSLFDKVSNLDKLINIFKYVLRFVSHFDSVRQKFGISLAPRGRIETGDNIMKVIIKQTQQEKLSHVLSSLQSRKTLPENCKFTDLSPSLDRDDIIRVGGSLKNANIAFSVKHPVLIPKDHPIALLIIRHYHQLCKHQGPHISVGSIIQAGYFIENGRQLIRKFIKDCVICRKLRAPCEHQIMADLPFDSLEATPPFDIFGPFFIYDGIRRRSNKATKKFGQSSLCAYLQEPCILKLFHPWIQVVSGMPYLDSWPFEDIAR